jgi:hypothetical protein
VALGAATGDVVGAAVGCKVGAVGLLVGCKVGLAVGVVGAWVGQFEGRYVGGYVNMVGHAVGDVGLAVGPNGMLGWPRVGGNVNIGSVGGGTKTGLAVVGTWSTGGRVVVNPPAGGSVGAEEVGTSAVGPYCPFAGQTNASNTSPAVSTAACCDQVSPPQTPRLPLPGMVVEVRHLVRQRQTV